MGLLVGGWFTVKLLYGGETLLSIKGESCHSILFGVEVRICSTHHFICLFLSVIIIPELDLRCAVLHKVGPSAFLMQSYMPQMLPVTAATWMSLLS